MARRRIYVETMIRTDLPRLWTATQDPGLHSSWDLRFTSITHLPTPEGEPQRFTYANRALPGLALTGVGISLGERHRPDGGCTSALRFSADSALSPIATGAGYWRYVPDADGVRFLTGYDYAPGWQGETLDRFVARPLIGWMTAWSFDRLRLWLEHDITPRASLVRAIGLTCVRAGVAVGALVAAGATAGSRIPTWAALLAAALALVVPLPVRVPRARRCRRSPVGTERPPRITERIDAARLPHPASSSPTPLESP